MRIVWISDTAPAGFTTDAEYFEHHRLASMRLRIGIPARWLAPLGIESGFIGLDTPAVLEHLTPGEVDVVVFSKLSTPRGPAFEAFTTAYLGTADHARARGLGVIVDVVDNVLATDRRDFFVALLGRADAVTVATPRLAETVGQYSRVPVHVIGDPVEGKRGSARFAPPAATSGAGGRALRMLWFGGQYRNFRDLAALIPDLHELAKALPLDLTIVMNPDARIARDLEALDAEAPSGFGAHFVEWSLVAVAEALDGCDLVVLPADMRDEMRVTASANRLTRALWAGRAVVAHPLPAYREFEHAAILDQNLRAALGWALDHAADVEQRIAAGQETVAARYAPDAVGRRWREVLASLPAG